jgi:hypothetical protein
MDMSMKAFRHLGLGVVIYLLVTGSAFAGSAKIYAAEPEAVDPTAIRTVRVLSPEVSRSLKLTPLPTSRPIPLIVGTYWNCAVNAQDFEICRIKLVVCTDNQELCTEL